MQVYVFDNTLDGLLTAVFDSFFLHQQPEMLLGEGEQLPLFADEPHVVVTDSGKAARVWKGLEKHLSVEGLRMIAVSWLSEERTLNQPLFNFICKVFRQKGGNNPSSATDYLSLERNASDADVLAVERLLLGNDRSRFVVTGGNIHLAQESDHPPVSPAGIPLHFASPEEDHYEETFSDTEEEWIYKADRNTDGYLGVWIPQSE